MKNRGGSGAYRWFGWIGAMFVAVACVVQLGCAMEEEPLDVQVTAAETAHRCQYVASYPCTDATYFKTGLPAARACCTQNGGGQPNDFSWRVDNTDNASECRVSVSTTCYPK